MDVHRLEQLASPLLRDMAQCPVEALNVAAGFFTCWGLAAHALARGCDTRLLALLVAVGGGYITYVHPRCLLVPMPRGPSWYCLSGAALHAVDLLFHQLPLLVILARRGRGPCGGGGGALLLLAAYILACGDPGERYGLRPCDEVALIVWVCLLSCVVWEKSTQ